MEREISCDPLASYRMSSAWLMCLTRHLSYIENIPKLTDLPTLHYLWALLLQNTFAKVFWHVVCEWMTHVQWTIYHSSNSLRLSLLCLLISKWSILDILCSPSARLFIHKDIICKCATVGLRHNCYITVGLAMTLLFLRLARYESLLI